MASGVHPVIKYTVIICLVLAVLLIAFNTVQINSTAEDNVDIEIETMKKIRKQIYTNYPNHKKYYQNEGQNE